MAETTTNDAAERLLTMIAYDVDPEGYAPGDWMKRHRDTLDAALAAAKQQGATEADTEWRKIAAAAHDAGYNEAQGFAEVRIEEAKTALLERLQDALDREKER